MKLSYKKKIKEFLKPTWSKLIIFSILFIIINGIILKIGIISVNDFALNYSDSFLYKIFHPGFIFGYLYMTETCPSNLCFFSIVWNTLIGSISLLLNLFYWYLLSCLIILIYNKNTNKK